MPITLDGTGSITGLTTTGISAVQQLPAGSVLQVVVGSAGYTTTTSASYVDTGVSASITPKFSTSKVLVIVSLNGITSPSASWNFVLTDSANTILQYLSNYNSAVNITAYNASYLLSPGTTSALTYKVRFNVSGGNNLRINDYAGNAPVSTIILIEVAG